MIILPNTNTAEASDRAQAPPFQAHAKEQYISVVAQFLGLAVLFSAFSFCSRDAFAQSWITRHGLSPAEYQNQFDVNAKKGYRLTQVNGYTDGGRERYVAIWQKISGPPMIARHGLSSADYQKAFNKYTKQGYRLTWVSGYGVGNAAKFAAVWEKKSGGAWLARHNLTAAQFQSAFDDNVKKGYRLRHVSGYVVGNVEYFAAIWVKGSGGAWQARHNLSAAQYQSAFDDLGKQGYVLTDVSGYTKRGQNLYAAIWEKFWSPLRYARHGIAGNNYQNVHDNLYYQGYRPLLVQGYASGSGAKFNGIWVNSNMSSRDMAKLDDAANNYMKSQSVTGMSLAVMKNGKLVFAKGYGMSDSNQGLEMSPNHSLRIWSVSKPVTSVGIMKLLKGKPNLLEQKVFGSSGVLGNKYPTPPNRQGLNNIKVKHLLSMTSGLRTCNGESVFWSTSSTVANVMSTLMKAADLITTAPDTQYIYSNTNFFFIARVIEETSGQTYETYIRNNVLKSAGIGDTMYIGRADGTSKAGEATYSPQEKPNMQLFDGFGGWVARPQDLLKFLRVVDGNPNPDDILDEDTHTKMTTGTPQNMGYGLGWLVSGDQQSHNGCFSGGRSFLVELSGGLSYAVIINSEPKNDSCGWTMKGTMEPAIISVSNYPTYDLF